VSPQPPAPEDELPSFNPPEPVEEDTPTARPLIWAGLFLSLVVFTKVPHVDLWMSMRYWSPEHGFFLSQNPIVQALYTFTPRVGYALVATALLYLTLAPLLARLAQRRQRPDLLTQVNGLWRRTALGGLMVAALSSGLVVELGLKDHVGRPRPVQTDVFGGDMPFHPIFQGGPTPEKHRSFSSGHAATGFSLMIVGLFASPVWRRRWFIIGLTTGAIVGLGRIMQGGHYLSDVVFSFYVVWLSCELVAYGFKRYDLSKLPPWHPARIGPRRAIR
jgi:lipid A 4'-phosphatase